MRDGLAGNEGINREARGGRQIRPDMILDGRLPYAKSAIALVTKVDTKL